MRVKAGGNFLRNAQMVHTGAGRRRFQAYLLYEKNNFCCYRAEKAEDKVKQADLSCREKTVFSLSTTEFNDYRVK